MLVRCVSILLTVMNLMAATPAAAVELEIGQGISFQSFNDSKAENQSILAAGSVVDVPDQYRVNNANGKINSELTLNNWLKNAGRTGLKAHDHEGGILARTSDHVDYFYPVKIVFPAPGSRVESYGGQTYFLALRMLTRTQNTLTTNQPTPVHHAVPGESEASSLCPDGTCSQQHPMMPSVQHLMNDVNPILQKLDHKELSNQRRTAVDFRQISSQFARSCGFSLKSFIPYVRKYSEQAKIPMEVMLSIMVQESSGRCYSQGYNDNSTSDSGLFGLNSGSTHVRRCSTSEVDWMRRVQPSQLESGPQCRENPIVNLKTALGVLNHKIESLSNRGGFDERKLEDANGNHTQLALRLAVSSYNGGEGWVLKAKKDLEIFNRRFGSHLDPYSWEDLRLFYLRHELSENKEEQYFGSVQRGRSTTAIANLSYAENIVPRGRSQTSQSITVAELWQQYDSRDL